MNAGERTERVGNRLENLSHQAQEMGHKIGERFEGAKDVVGEQLRTLDRQTRTFVEEHPFLSLGIALGAGFMVARLVSKL